MHRIIFYEIQILRSELGVSLEASMRGAMDRWRWWVEQVLEWCGQVWRAGGSHGGLGCSAGEGCGGLRRGVERLMGGKDAVGLHCVDDE